MKEQEYLVGLNMVEGMGPVKIAELLKGFSLPSRIAGLSANKLAALGNIGPVLAQRICRIFEAEELKNELRRISNLGIKIITIIDKDYPYLLRQIYDPPPVLYVLGDAGNLHETCVAVVGCRRASFYGLQQARHIGRQLSARGICVVSGLARGIDSAAHRGALDENKKTVAVLGSGLNCIYPRENKDLFGQIAKAGTVVSEFPLLMAPQKGNFPRRNRIISGLSLAVIVVEAAKRSGSLITANFALEQGRDVFAVPGPANSINAQGTNKLIKEGAKLVESAQDIIEELNLKLLDLKPEGKNKDRPDVSRQDKEVINAGCEILDLLSTEPLHIDGIVQKSKQDSARVYRQLLELELKGLVKELGGKRYVRVG
ncbi:MAG: DNA-processing protein DprA [Candidatus Omnitrophica bacterium]|nr:DNA-processing protein DprA [Candidatus Omnitrophota bacterium]